MRDGWDGCHMKVERECGRVSFDLKVRIMEMMSVRYEKLWKSLMILMKENRLSASDWLLANSWPPVRCAYWGILRYFSVSRYLISEERGASVCSSLWQSHLERPHSKHVHFRDVKLFYMNMRTIVIWIYGQSSSGYMDNEDYVSSMAIMQSGWADAERCGDILEIWRGKVEIRLEIVDHRWKITLLKISEGERGSQGIMGDLEQWRD